MPKPITQAAGLIRSTASEWMAHRAPQLGAALAFYTLFAVAPLFLIILAIAGLWFGEEAASRQLFAELQGLVGQKGSEAIQSVIAAADRPKTGLWATVAGLGTALVGATGVFVQLQAALNTIWNVRRQPGKGLKHFLRDRLVSFAMILTIGFILLVSLVVNALLSALGTYMSGLIPAQENLWQLINFLVSLGAITFLFAMIFKVLPDVKIAWRDVWIGALITALFFTLGKFLLGLYLARSTVASAYGAAGSLVIVLLWVYYSSQILFFGAEFTRLYAMKYGSYLRPVAGAEFVAVKEAKTDEQPQPGSSRTDSQTA